MAAWTVHRSACGAAISRAVPTSRSTSGRGPGPGQRVVLGWGGREQPGRERIQLFLEHVFDYGRRHRHRPGPRPDLWTTGSSIIAAAPGGGRPRGLAVDQDRQPATWGRRRSPPLFPTGDPHSTKITSQTLCNPVKRRRAATGEVTPIRNAEAHLVCFAFKQPRDDYPRVQMK